MGGLRTPIAMTGEDPRKPSPLVGEGGGGGPAQADCHETKLDGANSDDNSNFSSCQARHPGIV